MSVRLEKLLMTWKINIFCIFGLLLYLKKFKYFVSFCFKKYKMYDYGNLVFRVHLWKSRQIFGNFLKIFGSFSELFSDFQKFFVDFIAILWRFSCFFLYDSKRILQVFLIQNKLRAFIDEKVSLRSLKNSCYIFCF